MMPGNSCTFSGERFTSRCQVPRRWSILTATTTAGCASSRVTTRTTTDALLLPYRCHWPVLARPRRRVFPDLDRLARGRVLKALACAAQRAWIGRLRLVPLALEEQRRQQDRRLHQQPPGRRYPV